MLPILYQNHDLILYSYPLLMGLGWGIAYQIFMALADVDVRFRQVIFWGLFLFSWIGSKLFFYYTAPANLQVSTSDLSFWTGGGFVFYGGLLSAFVFLCIYKLFKFPLSFQTIWAMLPALTLGHAIGRIGCLLAGCCFGKETDWWWGIELHGSHRHPTQLLESLGLMILGFYLLKTRAALRSISIYFAGYGILRFWIECLRGDLVRGLWGPFTPSQWISLSFVILGLVLILVNKYRRLPVSVQN